MSDEEFEYRTQTLAITDHINDEVAKLATEGWQIMPGTLPVAVYQLRRLRQGFGARGGISIDESKVHIIRGERKDG